MSLRRASSPKVEQPFFFGLLAAWHDGKHKTNLVKMAVHINLIGLIGKPRGAAAGQGSRQWYDTMI